MCCPTGDGAAAAILAVKTNMKQLAGGRKRARVAASVLTSDPYTDRDLTLPDVSTLTRRASKQAYEKAGIGAKDIALTELHDCFATAELVHYENLGLAATEKPASSSTKAAASIQPRRQVPVTYLAACSLRGIRWAQPGSRIFAKWSGI